MNGYSRRRRSNAFATVSRWAPLGAALLLGAVGLDVRGESSSSPTLLALDATEQRAVLRDSTGATAVRGVGDSLDGDRFVVRKILGDRVVLEERGRDGAPAAEIWVYRADEQGRSRVERVDRTVADTPAPPVRVFRPAQPGGGATP
jgi:hypothetical protein